ncbi:terpenoid synthase [Gloeophyllum trabeum ATCC 11539]|uniref:Terpene synthase n=1 Tax=Gloeophyllum trabeum (strain ATCC 11539 / FP-39264 / Madison 617) TaxID=670483 RepID=S7RGY3_GLOTA|nr:terpenoid synthase [Gloeophyllum trabeum ATCC 11539]EPQ53470.1 terpenoid synthase [Gloeophyllum trabeum ATCC 11539]
MTPEGFRLPNGLADWPWSRRLNPHYEIVKAESDAWIESFNALNDRARRAFKKCDFSLLACLAYPTADRQHARTVCDLMNLFFLFDELSDIETEQEVRKQADDILDALLHPHRATSTRQSVLGEAAREFAGRAVGTLSPTSYSRFVESFAPHVDAMVQQAQDRGYGYCNRQSVESYMSVRRGTIGAKPAFAFLGGDADIPKSVHSHPLIQDLETCCMDMLIMSNDIYSYNVEQARGDDGHNIISVVMHEKGLDIAQAMDWVEDQYLRVTAQFLKARSRLPSWGDQIDSQVALYANGLGNWARAGDQWCFETERYFGKRGLDVQKTRWVILLPKEGRL